MLGDWGSTPPSFPLVSYGVARLVFLLLCSALPFPRPIWQVHWVPWRGPPWASRRRAVPGPIQSLSIVLHVPACHRVIEAAARLSLHPPTGRCLACEWLGPIEKLIAHGLSLLGPLARCSRRLAVLGCLPLAIFSLFQVAAASRRLSSLTICSFHMLSPPLASAPQFELLQSPAGRPHLRPLCSDVAPFSQHLPKHQRHNRARQTQAGATTSEPTTHSSKAPTEPVRPDVSSKFELDLAVSAADTTRSAGQYGR